VKIYNKKIDKDIPSDAIYVGRPTKFGNPFSHLPSSAAIFRTESREEAVEKFREYLEYDTELKKMVKEELKGKSLVCWCSPQKCHAEVLMEIANS